jgi:hypothetical protein
VIRTSTVPVQAVHDALLALLRSCLAPHPVGDGAIPPGVAFPYGNLTSIDGGTTEGPGLGDPEELTTLAFQFDAVGQERAQAQALLDAGTTVLLGRDGGALLYPLGALDGWAECGRLREGSPAGTSREGTPPNAAYTGSVRIALTITPRT